MVGSDAEFKAMTAEAHKYGIRIIVDVVANHMSSDFNAIEGRWHNWGLYHHNGNVQSYNNRWDVTQQALLGLLDIRTEDDSNAYAMHDFLVDAVNDGADGFRFDAAKHIELPGEFNNSHYWDIVLKNGAQYQYGEVLQDSASRDSDYASLFSHSSRAGGAITASKYGENLRNAIKSRNLNAGMLGNYAANTDPSNLVTWVESHDNYSNNDRVSTGMTDEQIRFGWAVIGARAKGMPLFFDRPYASGGYQPQFAEKSQLGDMGSDAWENPSVTAVNYFRNRMEGEPEYLRNCGNNSCLMVERYRKDGKAATDGVVISNMGGDSSLTGTRTTLDNGTYKDTVNGGSLTVWNGTITSGTARGNAVSVYQSTDSTPSNPDQPDHPDQPESDDLTVYYPASRFGEGSTWIHYNDGKSQDWPDVRMEKACDGWLSTPSSTTPARPSSSTSPTTMAPGTTTPDATTRPAARPSPSRTGTSGAPLPAASPARTTHPIRMPPPTRSSTTAPATPPTTPSSTTPPTA